ncbi:MAG: hypothetical protein M3Q89_00915, partial [Verrucomicrobiota bacterium]|nr:hypothetical protein [Verrucomicrobiota bacterium]
SNYFDVGAQTLDVLRVVIAQGMKPVLIGLVAGMAAALALGRLLAAQLYEISPHNPLLRHDRCDSRRGCAARVRVACA